jgi:hypothetical protein
MAAWSTVVRMNKDMPSVRVVPQGVSGCRVTDFWDDTNKRWKSGVVVSTLNSGTTNDISWAAHSGGAAVATETLAAVIAPPNFNGANDSDYRNSGLDVNAVAVMNPSYKNACAVNYGRPGPSAEVQADGTIVYTAVDLTLSSNALTDIRSDLDVTVAGTLTATTGTNYDPYADNGGTISKSMTIAAGPLASKYFYSDGTALGDVGLIAAPIAANFTALVLQIQSIVTQYYPGPSGRMYQPVLRIQNPQGQPGAQRLLDWQLPITLSCKSTNTISEVAPWMRGFTAVYAVNAGSGKTVDANGRQMASLDVAVVGNSAYNLANCWIELPNGADGTAAATVAYKIKSNTGL